MKVLLASLECVPFAKVGGLADVAGALPKYLRQQDVDVRVVMPLYKSIDRAKFSLKKIVSNFAIYSTGECLEGNIWEAKIDGKVPVYFVENERLFGRDGIYGDSRGDYPDNALRYIYFSKAVFETCRMLGFKPDIIHCNDMQTGLIPAYLKTICRKDAFFASTKTVFTIHNVAYQGVFSRQVFYLAGFSDEYFTPEQLEFYGHINFMKAGIVYADAVTTVSKTYAKQISSMKEFGLGLEGVLASRKADLSGILNGIDYDYWNPATDPCISLSYSGKIPEGKKQCKKDLQERLGLAKKDVPIFGMVSRIVDQKGFDLIAGISGLLAKLPIQLVVLGLGDAKLQEIMSDMQKKYPAKFSVSLEFNEELAHKIYAGSDMFLMPSRYEPCGLGQMIAMRYGAVPVVHKTGGLADSVEEFNPATKKGTGFLFEEYSGEILLELIKYSIEVYKNKPIWDIITGNALSEDFSWESSVKEYIKVYKKVISN